MFEQWPSNCVIGLKLATLQISGVDVLVVSRKLLKNAFSEVAFWAFKHSEVSEKSIQITSFQ